ncbi:tetratricopeptide repeat protein [candidate division KSB1 bacterium]|nr:tetratricopeptide repeat protein [candidate division KSB1 bacterium]NIS25085.1 tetratricopeptide repeat protein [candidate division KSB1 bacterium]NIU25784.1 tetratricopeptide repeat protein [candidate division KSB1 bacterium]NIU93773.1 tetratricopeptide repeat protein [candidate division KSB1 bacterium]NIW19638.1 tetratricopeptide repeat protein [candidate division KSB1 bacterium]
MTFGESTFFSMLLVLLLGQMACNEPEEEALRPVEFPGLYLVEDEVEQQLKSEYARLKALENEKGVEQAGLGRAYGRIGKLFLAYDIVQQAEDALHNARVLMPDEVRWPYYLGYLYFTLGQLQQAAASYERARDLKPGEPTILIRLAETYQKMGRDAEAKELLEQALRIEPTSAKAHFLLGQIAHDHRAYDTAIKHYQAALEQQPEATSIHYALGMTYRNLARNMEDYDRSLQHLRKRGKVTVQLSDPFLDEVSKLKRGSKLLSSRGSTLMVQGRFREAEVVFERVVAQDSDNVFAYLNLGSVRSRLGKTEEAIEALERAVFLDSSQSVAQMLLGRLFAKQGNTNSAEQHYRAALAANPLNDEAHLGLATLLRQTGNYREAIPYFEKVLELTPGRAQAHLHLAVCHLQLGEYARARTLLEEAYEVFPYHRAIRDALVRVLAASPTAEVRDGQRALTLAEKPVAEANHTESAEARAMVYAELGRYSKALEWQEIAIKAARSQGRGDYLEHLKDNLQRYQKGEPSRATWTDFYEDN